MKKKKDNYPSQKEIKEALESQKRFKEYYEARKSDEAGSIYNLIIIMNFLKKEGWDFSKKGEEVLPKRLRNKNTEKPCFITEEGEVVFL